jgi:hypothetical protein
MYIFVDHSKAEMLMFVLYCHCICVQNKRVRDLILSVLGQYLTTHVLHLGGFFFSNKTWRATMVDPSGMPAHLKMAL